MEQEQHESGQGREGGSCLLRAHGHPQTMAICVSPVSPGLDSPGGGWFAAATRHTTSSAGGGRSLPKALLAQSTI